MAILGIGQDLVEIERVASSIAEFGDRFKRKVFTPIEISYCDAKSNSAESYAARFAAKEAVAKAFQTGIGEKLNWHNIEITNSESGTPRVTLSPKFTELFPRLRRVHISLSHTHVYATAFAILED